jgi:hypothetical protein
VIISAYEPAPRPRETTGFSRVVLQFQPTNATRKRRDHRLQPRGPSVSTYAACAKCSSHDTFLLPG